MADPFFLYGFKMSGQTTTFQAIRVANLDWRTEKCPLRVALPMAGNMAAIKQDLDEAQAIVRSTDRKILGIVSEKYHLFQNRDVFQFLDNIIAKGYATIKRAGTFHDDKMLWLLMALPGDISVTKINDRHKREQLIERLFLVSMTHDTDNTLEFSMLPTRDDGTILNFNKTGTEMRISHHIHNANEIQRGLAAFTRMAEHYTHYAETIETLKSTRFSASLINQWVKIVFGDMILARAKEVTKLFMLERFEDTALSAIAAMCRYIDSLPVSEDSISQAMGPSRQLKQKAILRLADLIA